jgi:ABC-type sugar transport system substrate-binding protein
MRHPISHSAALCVAFAIVVTGCSSTSKPSPASSAAGATGTSSATPASSAKPLTSDQLVTLANAAAAKAGKPIALPKITIGYLRYVAQAPSDQRMYDNAVAAATVLGWKIIQCDGQGDPAKMAACGNTLLNQKIDVLLNDGIPETILATSLRRAKAMGIPTIHTGGNLEQADLYTGGNATPDGLMAQVLAGYLKDQIKGKPGGVIVQGFPASWGIERVNALKATGVNILSNQDADATNLVQGTQVQIAAQLNQHPDASAIWITFDTASLGAAQALAAKFPGKTYPDRPLLVTFYANQPTLQLIRQGKLDAAIEDSIEWCSWVAIDQIAELVARKTPMSPDLRPDYGTGLDFWRPVLVTKDNLPAEGALVPPPVDYISFFKTKWKTEFNAGS